MSGDGALTEAGLAGNPGQSTLNLARSYIATETVKVRFTLFNQL